MDTTPPIIKNNNIYYIRLLYQAVEEKLYLDFRKFEDVSTNNSHGYRATEEGLVFEIDDWADFIPYLFKLFEKARKLNRGDK